MKLSRRVIPSFISFLSNMRPMKRSSDNTTPEAESTSLRDSQGVKRVRMMQISPNSVSTVDELWLPSELRRALLDSKKLEGLRVIHTDRTKFVVDTKFDSHFSHFEIVKNADTHVWEPLVGSVVVFDDMYYDQRPIRSLAELTEHITRKQTIRSLEQLLAGVLFYCFRTGVSPNHLPTSIVPTYMFSSLKIQVDAFKTPKEPEPEKMILPPSPGHSDDEEEEKDS